MISIRYTRPLRQVLTTLCTAFVLSASGLYTTSARSEVITTGLDPLSLTFNDCPRQASEVLAVHLSSPELTTAEFPALTSTFQNAQLVAISGVESITLDPLKALTEHLSQVTRSQWQIQFSREVYGNPRRSALLWQATHWSEPKSYRSLKFTGPSNPQVNLSFTHGQDRRLLIAQVSPVSGETASDYTLTDDPAIAHRPSVLIAGVITEKQSVFLARPGYQEVRPKNSPQAIYFKGLSSCDDGLKPYSSDLFLYPVTRLMLLP